MIEVDFWSAVASASLFTITLISRYFLIRNKEFNPNNAIKFSNINLFKKNSGISLQLTLYRALPLLLWISFILLLIAFSRPRFGKELSSYKKQGIVIQFLIDRSPSMQAKMVFEGREMNRLDAVKNVFKRFVLGDGDQFSGRDDDLISVSTFARFVQENVPLTLDHENLIQLVNTLKPANTKVENATMIGDAIYYSSLQLRSAEDLIKKRFNKSDRYKIRSKVMILLTDGEQTQGGLLPSEAAKAAKENNIKIYTIAITGSRESLNQKIFSDFFGVNAFPKIDTSELEEAARLTGGFFAKADSGEDLLKIYQKIDELEKIDFEQKITVYKELFPYFLWPALILLFLHFILSNTILIKIP